MITIVQEKFNQIVKLGFQDILKPIGFKKQALNFYQFGNIVKVINIQKSTYNTAESIRFTINFGFFVPEFWPIQFPFHQDQIPPKYPKEYECAARYRIGTFKNQKDTWYVCDQNTNESALIATMRGDLLEQILPLFDSVANKGDLVKVLMARPSGALPVDRLRFYGELGHHQLAKHEFDQIQKHNNGSPVFLETVKQLGIKYGLN